MSLYGSLYNEDLPTRAKIVYINLKDRANPDGKCFPSLRKISEDTSLSKRTVQRAIDDLIAYGLLTKEARTRDNGGTSSNNYYVRL